MNNNFDDDIKRMDDLDDELIAVGSIGTNNETGIEPEISNDFTMSNQPLFEEPIIKDMDGMTMNLDSLTMPNTTNVNNPINLEDTQVVSMMESVPQKKEIKKGENLDEIEKSSKRSFAFIAVLFGLLIIFIAALPFISKLIDNYFK